MEIRTNAYQTPSMTEIGVEQIEILCASTFSPNQLDQLVEENDDSEWSDIF